MTSRAITPSALTTSVTCTTAGKTPTALVVFDCPTTRTTCLAVSVIYKMKESRANRS